MDLTLHQLRLFLAVVDHRTVTAAASAVGYTPSAVSQQLAGLDRAVGTPVFDKVGRGLRPSDAGRVLIPYARSLLDEAEAAQTAVAGVTDAAAASIELATVESVAKALLPGLLAHLRARHPEIDVRIHLLDPTPAIERIRERRLDLAVNIENPIAPHGTPDGMFSWPIIEDQYRLVVPADDPITGPVRLADLADATFVSAEHHDLCGRFVVAACRAAGFEPRSRHELDDYPTMLHLIAAGEGVGLVPGLGLTAPPAGIRILPLAQPLARHISIVGRRSSEDRRAYQVVRQQLLEVAAGLDPSINKAA